MKELTKRLKNTCLGLLESFAHGSETCQVLNNPIVNPFIEMCDYLFVGEDKTVNMITESHLRSLFDTGHGKSGGDIEVPVDSDKDDDDGQDKQKKAMLLNKQPLKPRKGSYINNTQNSYDKLNIFLRGWQHSKEKSVWKMVHQTLFMARETEPGAGQYQEDGRRDGCSG